jgi:hypothetical protein
MTTRQTYVDSTLSSALTAGCDIVQPKFRGLWTRIELNKGSATCYSPSVHTETAHSLTHFDLPSPDVHGTLIGDLIGPPHHEISRIFVWDCWSVGNMTEDELRPTFTDIRTYPYRDRFALAKQTVSRIGLPLVLVKNYPIARATELWSIDEPTWCGLVFRCSRDPVGVEVRVARKYRELPRELQ